MSRGSKDRPASIPLTDELRALVEEWSDHPELDVIADRVRIAAAAGRGERLRSLVAEASVARRLLERGAALRFEVPTPSGRSADFEVVAGDMRFYLHVKSMRQGTQRHGRVRFSSRLRSLERIRRPFIVAVRWREGLSDQQDALLVQRTGAFIRSARVGEELVIHDADGTELGGCRVIAPWSGDHVSLVIGLPSGFVDEAPRLQRLLRRAYRQFMPSALNVILVGLPSEALAHDFEAALLGSPVERWDLFPEEGRRVAHGRAADGFWSGRHYDLSNAAGWFVGADDARIAASAMLFRARSRPEPWEQERLATMFG
ncbi:MAG: hypothetical protein KDA22_13640 [Phycisphaerales bacterium]|nr:hypothetical protein [Phycisphaerales bacterium]